MDGWMNARIRNGRIDTQIEDHLLLSFFSFLCISLYDNNKHKGYCTLRQGLLQLWREVSQLRSCEVTRREDVHHEGVLQTKTKETHLASQWAAPDDRGNAR